jgi:predicted metal-dependent hydrolase
MTAPTIHAGLQGGLDLFNRGRFFEAHEVLEDFWRSLPRDLPRQHDSRQHVQGLVQLAVAFHHQSTGNRLGACSVLERALRNLNGSERSFPELDLERLRAELEPWRQYLQKVLSPSHNPSTDSRCKIAPALPKIKRCGKKKILRRR